MEISGDVTDAGRRRTNERTREDSALSQWTPGRLREQIEIQASLYDDGDDEIGIDNIDDGVDHNGDKKTGRCPKVGWSL